MRSLDWKEQACSLKAAAKEHGHHSKFCCVKSLALYLSVGILLTGPVPPANLAVLHEIYKAGYYL